MFRSRLAAALSAALVALCPASPSAEAVVRLDTAPQWRSAADMDELVAVLELWLDRQSDWPRRSEGPRIRLVSAAEAAARQGDTSSLQRGRLRGFYDSARSEILLVAPWNPRDATDVSVLLHEMVHHRQAPHYWYCPAAQELPAYRLQDEWLAERGLSADVNWIAVVIDAGCTRRDIHPD